MNRISIGISTGCQPVFSGTLYLAGAETLGRVTFFAIFTITRRNPVTAVMSLVGTFFGLAAIYASLSAHFLAVIQVLVYAGAIMVLFIFVVMILNREEVAPQAAEELLPAVYDELRRLAAGHLAAESAGQTLQPTALVHEAYLKLVGSADPGWNGRGHFFGAAAQAMRELIVDHVRRKSAASELRRVQTSAMAMQFLKPPTAPPQNTPTKM